MVKTEEELWSGVEFGEGERDVREGVLRRPLGGWRD